MLATRQVPIQMGEMVVNGRGGRWRELSPSVTNWMADGPHAKHTDVGLAFPAITGSSPDIKSAGLSMGFALRGDNELGIPEFAVVRLLSVANGCVKITNLR